MPNPKPQFLRQNSYACLKDITPEQMAAYLKNAHEYHSVNCYSDEQRDFIRAAMAEAEIVRGLKNAFGDESIEDALLFAYVAGFQLGRDFQTRQVAEALWGNHE